MSTNYVSFKLQLSNKLADAYKELRARCQDSSLKDIQRMYGVVLGIRIAILEWNKAHNSGVSYAGMLAVESLMNNDFSHKTLKEFRDYPFPEF